MKILSGFRAVLQQAESPFSYCSNLFLYQRWGNESTAPLILNLAQDGGERSAYAPASLLPTPQKNNGTHLMERSVSPTAGLDAL